MEQQPQPQQHDDGTTEQDEATVRTGAKAIHLDNGARVGRHIVLELLGRGGMGSVFAAWDPQLGRRVALKIMHVVGPNEDAERARLLHEARAIAQLSHPNVVRVFDVGDVDTTLGPLPYIAMELVEGHTLADAAADRSDRAVVDTYLDAARGLAAVHAIGIVHRDFKPANVLVGRDGRVCISDFGLAIIEREESGGSSGGASPSPASPAQATTTTTPPGDAPRKKAEGTPAFMAPEQFRADPVDARADQYAFCLAMWRALYGADPFDPERVARRASDRLALLEEAAPRAKHATLATRAFEPVLRRGLAFHPKDRFADMNALIAALVNARARPKRMAAAGAVVVVVGALVTFAVTHRGEPDACGVHARARGAFSDDARAAIVGKLREAGLSQSSSAAGSFGDATTHLDAYVARWTAAAETVCMTPDDAVAACLDRRLDEVSALVAALRENGARASLSEALPSVLALRPPARCLVEKGPNVRRNTELEKKLAAATAAQLAGRPVDAKRIAHEVRMAALGSATTQTSAVPSRIVGDAARVEGNAAADTGELVEAEALLRTAVAGAMAAGDVRAEADAWVDLLALVGDRAHRSRDAEAIVPFVEASLARVADDDELIAKARYVESLVAGNAGRLADAEHLAREACALADKRVPRDPRFISRAHSQLGLILDRLGRPRDGIAEILAGRTALEGALPPNHFAFAAVDNNIGLLYQRAGDVDKAKASYESALKIVEAGGQVAPAVAAPINNLAALARERGDTKEARASFTRAHEILVKTVGVDHIRTSISSLGLALVDADEGDHDHARALVDDVIRVRRASAPHGPELAEALMVRGELALEERTLAVGDARGDLRDIRADLADARAILGDTGDPAFRAEIELADAVAAALEKKTEEARAALVRSRRDGGSVLWRGYLDVADVAARFIDGERVPQARCAALPRSIAVARVLARTACRR